MEMNTAQSWYMFYGESIPSADKANENWDSDFQSIYSSMLEDIDFDDQARLSEKLEAIIDFVKKSFQMSLEDDAPEYMPYLSQAYVVMLVIPLWGALNA